jgi:hypothetical protein
MTETPVNPMPTLEAIAAAFVAAGSTGASIEHTGGGIFVVVVPTPTGTVIVSEDGLFDVGFYPGPDWWDTENTDCVRMRYDLTTIDSILDVARGMGALA